MLVAAVAVALLAGACARAEDEAEQNEANEEEQTAQEDTEKPEAEEPELAETEVWPFFRGPNGNGRGPAQDIPLSWDEDSGENIIWKADLPLLGPNSPLIWKDKVFLTAGDAQTRKILAFNAHTGEQLWEKEYPDTGANNDLMVDGEYMYASPTGVVTDEYVVSHFANGDLVCHNHAGELQWAINLADTSANMYGQSCSLTRLGDTVICQLDDGISVMLYARDIKTGEEVWTSELEDNISWASPTTVQTAEDQYQVLVAASPFAAGFNAKNGEKLWWVDILGGDMAPSPLYVDGKAIFLFMGYGIHAIDPTVGTGDVTSKLAWSLDGLPQAGLPDTTSPATDGKYMYVFNAGFLACVDAIKGEVVYEHDTGEYGTYASPMVIGDKVLVPAGQKTLVVQAGPEYKELGVGNLDSSYDCTPVAAHDRIYIRSNDTLYCIGKGEE
jgi:outer membrane protein assembly factor BamB